MIRTAQDKMIEDIASMSNDDQTIAAELQYFGVGLDALIYGEDETAAVVGYHSDNFIPVPEGCSCGCHWATGEPSGLGTDMCCMCY